MIPVDQSRFGGPLDPDARGDCMAACVASIFGVALGDVPDLCAAGENWAAPLRRWLWARGLDCVTIGKPEEGFGAFDLDAWGILAVPSRFHRNADGAPALHAVVWRAGKIEHDPSSRLRGVGAYDVAEGVTLDLFVALDPARMPGLPWSNPASDPDVQEAAYRLGHGWRRV